MFSVVVKGDETITDRQAISTPLPGVPPSLPFIIGGTVLGVVVLVVVIAALVLGFYNPKNAEAKENKMEVKRVARSSSLNSTRKRPNSKIIR